MNGRTAYVMNKVVPYRFDDDEINTALADLNRVSCATVQKCKKQILFLKVLLILSFFLLTALIEYMMFVSLWYMDPVFKGIMIFTPLLAGTIGYLAADIIDRSFDLKYGLFNSEFQYAYENNFIYLFRGEFQGIQNDEKLWTNVIAGDFIWRVRNKMQNLQEMEGKEVFLLLTRNYFDDDVDFECIYVKAA